MSHQMICKSYKNKTFGFINPITASEYKNEHDTGYQILLCWVNIKKYLLIIFSVRKAYT